MFISKFQLFIQENLDAIEQYIKETSDKIDLMNEEKNRTEIELKLEELKQKACSDETIKFMDILVKGLNK